MNNSAQDKITLMKRVFSYLILKENSNISNDNISVAIYFQ